MQIHPDRLKKRGYSLRIYDKQIDSGIGEKDAKNEQTAGSRLRF
jgi:hypothetical protein